MQRKAFLQGGEQCAVARLIFHQGSLDGIPLLLVLADGRRHLVDRRANLAELIQAGGKIRPCGEIRPCGTIRPCGKIAG